MYLLTYINTAVNNGTEKCNMLPHLQSALALPSALVIKPVATTTNDKNDNTSLCKCKIYQQY